MTREEYFRELKEKAAKAWAEIFQQAKKGKYPPKWWLAQIVFEFGVEPATDEAAYVARYLAGEIKPGRGNDGRARGYSDEWLRWFYRRELESLQVMKRSDPKAYRATFGDARPSDAAREKVATEKKVGIERMRKLSKKMGV
jgi:hypothetical protein